MSLGLKVSEDEYGFPVVRWRAYAPDFGLKFRWIVFIFKLSILVSIGYFVYAKFYGISFDIIFKNIKNIIFYAVVGSIVLYVFVDIFFQKFADKHFNYKNFSHTMHIVIYDDDKEVYLYYGHQYAKKISYMYKSDHTIFPLKSLRGFKSDLWSNEFLDQGDNLKNKIDAQMVMMDIKLQEGGYRWCPMSKHYFTSRGDSDMIAGVLTERFIQKKTAIIKKNQEIRLGNSLPDSYEDKAEEREDIEEI